MGGGGGGLRGAGVMVVSGKKNFPHLCLEFPSACFKSVFRVITHTEEHAGIEIKSLLEKRRL